MRDHLDELADKPTWLFSVGPLGNDIVDDEEQPVELAEFSKGTGYLGHVVFNGALDHSKLDHADRMTMKTAGAAEGDFRDFEVISVWVDGLDL